MTPPHRVPSTLHVGRVARAQGLDGQLRLSTFDHEAPSLRAGITLLLRDAKGADTRVAVREVKRHAQGILVRVEGVGDRTAAESLVGREVHVPVDALPALAEGEYWAFALAGFEAHDERGAPRGTVVSVDEGRAHDLLSVRVPSGQERDVPMIPEFVVRVDPERRVIVLRPIPGLLDDEDGAG
jgi:16S rRNA processing protein RimM